MSLFWLISKQERTCSRPAILGSTQVQTWDSREQGLTTEVFRESRTGTLDLILVFCSRGMVPLVLFLFIDFLFTVLLNCLLVMSIVACLCVGLCLWIQHLWRPEGVWDSPAAGVIGPCQLPKVGTGNLTLSSKTGANTLNCYTILQPFVVFWPFTGL